MDETTYLQLPAAVVTSSRIEINGQTFAVRNVGSVKVVEVPRKWIGGFVFLVIALILGGKSQAWAGAVIFGLCGIALIARGAPKYRLSIVAGGGEVVALESRDAGLVEQLRAAVAQAIAAR